MTASRGSRADAGFSLLEMIAAIGIFSILTVGMFTLFASSNTAYYRGQSLAEAQQNARTAIEAVTREVRMAGYDTSSVLAGLSPPAPIQTGNANSITFVADVTGDGTLDQVTYQLSGTTLVRGISSWNGAAFPSAVSGEMAGGIAQLTFSYFDASDASIATPVASGSLVNIKRVAVSILTTATSAGLQRTYPIVEDARLRN